MSAGTTPRALRRQRQLLKILLLKIFSQIRCPPANEVPILFPDVLSRVAFIKMLPTESSPHLICYNSWPARPRRFVAFYLGHFPAHTQHHSTHTHSKVVSKESG